MAPTRTIAMLLTLAIALTGPAWAAAGTLMECCCLPAAGTADTNAVSSDQGCCPSEPADQGSRPAPERDHQDCDCTMPCCAAGKTMPLVRGFVDLELPEAQPHTLIALEPESHAVRAHFSLLRPPRS